MATDIALIAGAYRPDRCGVAHYTAHLREVLAARGMQSVVLTNRHAARALAHPAVFGVTDWWRPPDLLPLARAVHASGAGLLHIQHAAGTYGFERAVFLLPLLLRATGWWKPIVTTVHEYGGWDWKVPVVPRRLLEGVKNWGQRRGCWDGEDGFLLTQSNAIVTTNRETLRVIVDRLPSLAARLHLIPLGPNIPPRPIDREKAQRIVREAAGWPRELPVIAFFGFLHWVKGLDTLLQAFRKVLDQRFSAGVLMMGGFESLALRGTEAPKFHDWINRKIAELDLKDRVHLTGYQSTDTVSHFLQGVDIGVLPFNHGVTLKSSSLLTFLAHGVPSVVTRHDPPDPVLEDLDVVHKVAPRDADALARVLMRLLADARERGRLAGATRQAGRQFNWLRVGEHHQALYQQLLPNSLPRHTVEASLPTPGVAARKSGAAPAGRSSP